MIFESAFKIWNFWLTAFSGNSFLLSVEIKLGRWIVRWTVDDTGLQLMGLRWYDPQLGRFISRDPIGLRGGLNLYSYVDSVGKPSLNLYEYAQNNPLTYADPLGLWAVSVGFSATGGGGGGGTSGFGITFGSGGVGGYGSVGAGGYGGIGGSATVNVGFSPSGSVTTGSVVSGQVGASGGEGLGGGFDVNIAGDNTSYSGNFGFVGGLPFEEHGFITRTSTLNFSDLFGGKRAGGCK